MPEITSRLSELFLAYSNYSASVLFHTFGDGLQTAKYIFPTTGQLSVKSIDSSSSCQERQSSSTEVPSENNFCDIEDIPVWLSGTCSSEEDQVIIP